MHACSSDKMYRNNRDGMPNCKMFTYKATSLPTLNLVSGFLNDTMHFSCYIYVPTSSSSMLCDVACRNHTADIIFHNSCSSSHFIGCTTTLEFCMSCKQYRLAFNSPPPWTYNKGAGSHASASALFICSTKSGILL